MKLNYTENITICETYSQIATKLEEVKDKERSISNSIGRRDRGESMKIATSITSTYASKSK